MLMLFSPLKSYIQYKIRGVKNQQILNKYKALFFGKTDAKLQVMYAY